METSSTKSVNERYEIGYSFLNYIVPNFKILIFVQTLVLVTAYLFVWKNMYNLGICGFLLYFFSIW